jgi:hypothetical protein
MAAVERTLVKSLPELWEMLDEPKRMHGLIRALVGRAVEVRVVSREPEERLRWEADLADEAASIEVRMEEKGWGTHVEIEATREREDGLTDWIEAVMEELSEPGRRPFQGIV